MGSAINVDWRNLHDALSPTYYTVDQGSKSKCSSEEGGNSIDF